MWNDNYCSETEYQFYDSRREFLAKASTGFGMLGLAGLLGQEGMLVPDAHGTAAAPLAPKKPHFNAKAQHVVQVFASGAPTHVDTWDYKPALRKNHCKHIPGGNQKRKAIGSPFKFNKQGQSGVRVSEVWQNLKNHIDDMAVINSMYEILTRWHR